jgi:hypothetical protein
MRRLWKVDKHTGNAVELERDGEFLEIELPNEPGSRLIFLTLREGQIVHDEMIQILMSRAYAN